MNRRFCWYFLFWSLLATALFTILLYRFFLWNYRLLNWWFSSFFLGFFFFRTLFWARLLFDNFFSYWFLNWWFHRFFNYFCLFLRAFLWAWLFFCNFLSNWLLNWRFSFNNYHFSNLFFRTLLFWRLNFFLLFVNRFFSLWPSLSFDCLYSFFLYRFFLLIHWWFRCFSSLLCFLWLGNWSLIFLAGLWLNFFYIFLSFNLFFFCLDQRQLAGWIFIWILE